MSEAASKMTTVILTTGDLEKVDRLAETEDRSRGNMLRKLIRDAHEPARRADPGRPVD